MAQLVLKRFCSSVEMGTFGKIHLPEWEFFTVERPWLDNRPYISCIPPGKYRLGHTYFARGKYDTWQVLEVPNRTLIKFHIANFPTDVMGCIGIGKSLACIDQKWAVNHSKEAFEQFYSILGESGEHELEIKYVY